MNKSNREQSYKNLGHLLSIANSFHGTLVLALSKYLQLDPHEGAILFDARATGDLKKTFVALIKHKAKSDNTIDVNNITQAISKLNTFIARTNHVHGQLAQHATPIGQEPDNSGVTFKTPSLGDKFSYKTTRYDTAQDFTDAVERAHESLLDLSKALKITANDFNIYINIRFDEQPFLLGGYDPL